jgi:hypothetical protein
MKCEYGCGLEATHQFKNGKWCCSKNFNSCISFRNKQSKARKGISYNKSKKIMNLENKLCEYGCGQEAKYQFSNGTLCCGERWICCKINSDKQKNSKKGIHPSKSKEIKNIIHILCGYGCKTEAKYQLNNGKYCCSKNWQTCPENKKKNINSKKGLINAKPIEIENIENKLCDYGCGQEAKYKFKYGKLCCSKNIMSCKSIKTKNSISHIGLINAKPIEIENIENKLCEYGCNQIAKYKSKNGKLCCCESFNNCIGIRNKKIGRHNSYKIRNKMRKSQTKSIKYWKEKYPTFAKVEEIRYDPDKPGEKEIQGHCKNHNCPNSKEQGGWFTPTYNQLNGRIRCLEHPLGNDGGYFYCCDECKHSCPLFNMYADPNILIDINTIPLESEKNIWRQEVLKRQFDGLGYNECEYCGNRELNQLVVHHEKPQKTHSIMALDPDNGVICCGYIADNFCHTIHGHPAGTECSTGNLAHNACT